MPNLQIKGIDESLYAQIKELAASENRSISQQILFLAKQYLARRQASASMKAPAEVLLELCGSWEDERSAQEIIDGIRTNRYTSQRFKVDI